MTLDLVLWATIGLLLNAVGYTLDSWEFWCFIGVFWALGQLSRQRGKIEGIIDYIDMSESEQKRLQKALKEARGEDNV